MKKHITKKNIYTVGRFSRHDTDTSLEHFQHPPQKYNINRGDTQSAILTLNVRLSTLISVEIGI
jgi:hypothetical protein